MTDCPDGMMRDLLPEYARGVLGAPDALRVAAHLATCAECRAELVLLGRVHDSLSLGVPPVDVASIVRALPAAPRRSARPAAFAWKHWHWQYAAAAAALVMVAGGGMMWRGAPDGAATRLADSSHVRAAVRPESTPPSPASAHADEGISFGGGLSDLSVEDLQTLLGQMSSIKALPSTDPESMTPVIATNEGGKTL